MGSMSLSQLAQGLADVPPALATVAIEDLTLDSRCVEVGSGFVAIQGLENDGRKFIGEAFARGATVVFAESEGADKGGAPYADARVISVPKLKAKVGDLAKRFYADPSSHMHLLAVTGTNGKTSITDYMGQLLRLLGGSAGTIGTLGARSFSGEAAEAQNTTPDIISLNRQLAAWVDQGVNYVAIEASSHALDQNRLAGLTVHTGVFSNLSRDHLDYHRDMTAYQRAKMRLFDEFKLKQVIFNADDDFTHPASGFGSHSAVGISLRDAGADVFAQVLSESASGMTLQLHSPFGSSRVPTNLHGRFNAFNIVAAITAVCGLGFGFKEVAAAASFVRPVEGRMQAVNAGEDIRVVIDYAHTPDALDNALRSLAVATAGDLWVVFGCGGDRDSGKRPEMGRVAASLAAKIIVTNDNPRTEDAQVIANQVMEGVQGKDVVVELDRALAIRLAITSAHSGDTVLIAGKGHESYQTIGTERLVFSDAEHARQALREREVGHV